MGKKDVIEQEFGVVDELADTLKDIKKQFGDGAVMLLGQAPQMDIEVIPSGSIALDYALGVGGYPRGRIVEIYGPESSGKTTLAIHAVAEAQRMGLTAAYIDVEHAFDRDYAAGLGVDVYKLLFSQPDCGEDALEISTRLIQSGKVGILVIDSVAALTPRAEIDGEMGEAKIGLQARLMSQALRKMASIISKTNTLCIFINQIREKIGVLFGNPETTTGGNALKFYASQRLEVRRSTTVKDGEEATANLTKVKVVKNKVAPPFRRAEFTIEFGRGIDHCTEIADMAAQFDVVHKSGSWFSYNGDKLCQGRANLIQLIEDNEDFAEELLGRIRAELTKKDSGVHDIDDILA